MTRLSKWVMLTRYDPNFLKTMTLLLFCFFFLKIKKIKIKIKLISKWVEHVMAIRPDAL
jgi:hypothetical protein